MGDPRQWWLDSLEQLAATPLVLRPEHISGVYALPPHHKDPFDRVPIAQPMAEGLAFVTSDADLALYASKALRIVR